MYSFLFFFFIFLSMPVISLQLCSERNFKKLNLIKTSFRSTMVQKRLSNMSILSIESEIASKLWNNSSWIINTKARKIQLNIIIILKYLIIYDCKFRIDLFAILKEVENYNPVAKNVVSLFFSKPNYKFSYFSESYWEI